MDNWEAPLDKKPKSKKRKAQNTNEPNATGSNTVAKKPKKARKRPMVGGEEKKPKTSTNAHLEDPKTQSLSYISPPRRLQRRTGQPARKLK